MQALHSVIWFLSFMINSSNCECVSVDSQECWESLGLGISRFAGDCVVE